MCADYVIGAFADGDAGGLFEKNKPLELGAHESDRRGWPYVASYGIDCPQQRMNSVNDRLPGEGAPGRDRIDVYGVGVAGYPCKPSLVG